MPRRQGFTLIEVLIALVIMGVVTGALYSLLNNTQRLSLAQAEQVTLQSNVRTGSLVVPNELRELNTMLTGAVGGSQNDILVALPNEITYRAMRGMGFVCQAPGANELRLASDTWTGVRNPDPARDGLYLFVDGDPDDEGDDGWLQLDITAAAVEPTTPCAGAPGRHRLTVPAGSGLDLLGIPLNTPVRMFEVMELKLTSADGEWWLGARSVKPGDLLQPVLGPLTANGFLLDYFNSAGTNSAGNLAAIQSVRVTIRGMTDGVVRAGGFGATSRPQEGLATQVLLRNSIRP